MQVKDTISRFLNSDHYSPDVVKQVSETGIAELKSSLGIVRLCFEMTNNRIDIAEAVAQRLMKQQYLGYELFQLTTARMIIACYKNDKNAFLLVLKAWLNGRKKTPQNWDNRVLEEPVLQKWLSEIDPKKLKPPELRKHNMSDDDFSFVKNVDGIPLKAVLENLEWLRQMQINDAPEDMAKTYRLVRLNRKLREAGFTSNKDFPDFTAALDENGNFIGSFLDH
jgi:hypothetical protein